MNGEKDLLFSITFWGPACAVLAMLLKQFDITIDAEGLANDIVMLLGAVTAIVGRVIANKRIASIFGMKVGGG